MVINAIGRELGSPRVGSKRGYSLYGTVRVDLGRVFTSKDLKKVKEQPWPSRYLQTHIMGWRNTRTKYPQETGRTAESVGWSDQGENRRWGQRTTTGWRQDRWRRTLQTTVMTVVSSLRGMGRLWAEEWPCLTCATMESASLCVECQLMGQGKSSYESATVMRGGGSVAPRGSTGMRGADVCWVKTWILPWPPLFCSAT